jgi:hypothetical protein
MTTRTNRSYPGGAPGLGATAGVIGALAGLLIPRAWIEELSWQLYLDRLIAAAAPPIGFNGQLVFALLLGLALALLGWLVASWLRVQPAAGGLTGLWARMRGVRSDDEPDAPYLRPMDRHPDAPARRPFSAARDVPVEEEWVDAPQTVVADEDELLLDAHFDGADDGVVTESMAPISWDDLDHVDVADTDPVPAQAPVAEQVDAAPEAPMAAVEAPAPAEPTVAAPAIAAPPEPLDLSMARLDELIARLEAGLSRRADTGSSSASTSAPTVTVDESVPAAAEPQTIVQNDGDFPHDPALAAALATLRRMNRNS